MAPGQRSIDMLEEIAKTLDGPYREPEETPEAKIERRLQEVERRTGAHDKRIEGLKKRARFSLDFKLPEWLVFVFGCIALGAAGLGFAYVGQVMCHGDGRLSDALWCRSPEKTPAKAASP